MGANPTQALGTVLFLVGFTLIAAALAADMNIIALLLGLASVAGSTVLFLKCKPWEHNED